RYAAFMKKEDDWGLLLSDQTHAVGKPPREPMSGSRIFDFTHGSLTDDVGGWTTAISQGGGWSWKWEAVERSADPATISVFQANQNRGSVRWERTPPNSVSGVALLPPRPPIDVPILAVAFFDRGDPVLYLYNAATGEQVRRLTGHAGRVYSAEFSEDG